MLLQGPFLMWGPPVLGMRGCPAQPRIPYPISRGAIAEPCAAEYALSASGVRCAAALGRMDLDGAAPSGSPIARFAKQPLQRVQRGVGVTCSAPLLWQGGKQHSALLAPGGRPASRKAQVANAPSVSLGPLGARQSPTMQSTFQHRMCKDWRHRVPQEDLRGCVSDGLRGEDAARV